MHQRRACRFIQHRHPVRPHYLAFFLTGAPWNRCSVKQGNILKQLFFALNLVLPLFRTAHWACIVILHFGCAAHCTHLYMKGLIVLHIFKHRVLHPTETPYPSVFVSVIGNVLRYQFIPRHRIFSAHLRGFLAVLCYIHAIFSFYRLLCLRHLHEYVIHLLYFVDARLRYHLPRVPVSHSHVAHRAVKASLLVPIHLPKRAALYGRRSFLNVVHFNKPQHLYFTAQHRFNSAGKLFILFMNGLNSRHRNGGIHFAFQKLIHDISDIRCFSSCYRPVFLSNVCRAIVIAGADVHVFQFIRICGFGLLQLILPFCQFFVFPEHVSSSKRVSVFGNQIRLALLIGIFIILE